MTARCRNKNLRNYKHYGGRGISVCDEWLGEDGFNNFCSWAMSNGFGEGLSLDRIDVDGNYSPENCRWSNRSVQNANRRSFGACEYLGVSLHSSGTMYVASVKQDGKHIFVYSSRSKNDCASKRNEFIITSGLSNPLNEIKPEFEDIRPRKEIIWVAKDKETGEILETGTLSKLAEKTGLCRQFIGQCIHGRRNSKKYEFSKREKLSCTLRGYSQ